MQLTINGKSRTFDQATFTVAQLVAELNLEGKRLAIECNGEIVPRSQFAQTLLAAKAFWWIPQLPPPATPY